VAPSACPTTERGTTSGFTRACLPTYQLWFDAEDEAEAKQFEAFLRPMAKEIEGERKKAWKKYEVQHQLGKRRDMTTGPKTRPGKVEKEDDPAWFKLFKGVNDNKGVATKAEISSDLKAMGIIKLKRF
jgi:hypothetical protein